MWTLSTKNEVSRAFASSWCEIYRAPQRRGLTLLTLFAEEGTEDVVDEALVMFKANCMFRNFKPCGPGDLVHVYLLLFIHQCLKG